MTACILAGILLIFIHYVCNVDLTQELTCDSIISWSKADEHPFLVLVIHIYTITGEMSQSRRLALPNELITHIIDEIASADIESFALCNKATYNLCGPAIRRIFEERYAVIRLGSPEDLPASYAFDDPSRGCHPLLFLARILSNPHIAQYPTELQVDIYIEDDEDDEDEIEDPERVTLKNATLTWSSELTSIAANNAWLTGEVRELWQRALLQPKNKFYYLGILLTMLPNLESITSTNMPDEAAPLVDMIWAIAKANQDSSSPVHEKALAKLHEVALEAHYGELGGELGIYASFAALPSMRSLSRSAIGGYTREAPINLPHHTRDKGCQLEVVKFVHSAVDAESFDGLLQLATALKTFTYHHSINIAEDQRFDAVGIVRALAKNASHSLEKLDLTADTEIWQEWDHDPLAHRQQCIPSLRDFARLRSLRIDDKLLQAPHWGGQVTRLVDILPASIRIIRLFREMRQDAWEEVFAGLVEGKPEMLPVLTKIVVEDASPMRRGLVDEFKAVGIEIKGIYMV